MSRPSSLSDVSARPLSAAIEVTRTPRIELIFVAMLLVHLPSNWLPRKPNAADTVRRGADVGTDVRVQEVVVDDAPSAPSAVEVDDERASDDEAVSLLEGRPSPCINVVASDACVADADCSGSTLEPLNSK